jgi:hypothetical protein
MFAYLNILFLVYSIFINCDLQIFRKTLVKMFLDQDEDIVFMETSMKLKYYPHVHIECVPLPRETGDMAPIYFKVMHMWVVFQFHTGLHKHNIFILVQKHFYQSFSKNL